MRIFLAPYNMRVSAARHLAEELGGSRILPENSRYRPRRSDVVVNWGRSNLPDYDGPTVYNKPEAVALAINKYLSFKCFEAEGVPTVEWTTHARAAHGWVEEGDPSVPAGFARTSITGRGGEGIVPFYHGTEYSHEGEPWPRAELYTRYFKRKAEYRVHVWRDQIIDVQQKKKRRGVYADPYVRSYDNGWVFCRGGVEAPQCVLDACIAAVRALGLDFGGVDVGYNAHHNRAAVFEVNSAPGIEGTTIDKYVGVLRNAII